MGGEATGMECDECGAEIRIDQDYHLLNLTEERREGREFVVLGESLLVQICAGCARSWSFEEGTREARQDPERCSNCGGVFGAGRYHCLNHYREVLRPSGELKVLEATMLLQFCPACRWKHDFATIRLSPRDSTANAI